MNRIETAPKPELFLSKRRLGWAGLAGTVGCAAVCALPMLAAVGLGSGVAAAITRFIRPGAELVAAGAIFAFALGFMAFRVRAKRRGGAQVGCGTSWAVPHADTSPGPLRGDRPAHLRKARFFFREGVTDAPIVCTRDMSLARAQLDGYRAAFAHLVGADRFHDGFRWRFRATSGIEARLRILAEREAECCRSLSYTLTRDGDHIAWETRGADTASSVLDEYFRLPQQLSEEPRPDHDVAYLKRAASDAGLAFAADAVRAKNPKA